MPFLDVRDILIRFGGLVAVNQFSFHVDRGEIVGIIGPNGAGKTTVFNIITGLYHVTSGSFSFDGKDMTDCTPEEILRAGISRTFQNIRLIQDMKVIENMMIGSHIKTDYNLFDVLFQTPRFKKGEAQRMAEAFKCLKEFGFDNRSDYLVKSLPYGDMRRLEIARAIITGAKLILLDEPAAGMNPHESVELSELIKKIRDQGYTILLIEHDMNVVMNVVDRLYVLDHGSLIAEGFPKDVKRNPTVIEAYLGGSENASRN